jgi:hypothetical protein
MLKNTELVHFWVFQSHMKYSGWLAGADLRQKCSLCYFTETWILVFFKIYKWTLGEYLLHWYTINYDKTKKIGIKQYLDLILDIFIFWLPNLWRTRYSVMYYLNGPLGALVLRDTSFYLPLLVKVPIKIVTWYFCQPLHPP